MPPSLFLVEKFNTPSQKERTIFACNMQLHAFALQPLQAPCNSMHMLCNSSETKKAPNNSININASIIKVFDFCWYQLHMSSGTTTLLNSAPMHFALAINSEPCSSIRHCHFDLPASSQLFMLLLLCGHLVARFN